MAAGDRVDRRADAVRNIDRILAAATDVLTHRPTASMADVARAAGLGRGTVYAHFGSRAELVDAVVSRLIDDGEKILADVDLSGHPGAALERLVRSSWHLLERSTSILVAAETELSAERIRDLHAGPAARVEALVDRGRREGEFRDDIPAQWLVAVTHQILHGAAEEIAQGRLAKHDAADVITATLMPVFGVRQDR